MRQEAGTIVRNDRIYTELEKQIALPRSLVSNTASVGQTAGTMTVTTMSDTPTILVFGGYTEPWQESIDRLHEQAGSCAWLRRFLDDVASVVRTETKCMHPKIRNSLGPSGVFTSVQELADQYRDHDDHVGFVQCIMSYIVRAATLLRYDEL
jgi:zearalenone synthase (nonreducing iterative type I polyketide synthase)